VSIHKYTAQVEKTWADSPAFRLTLDLEEFAALTPDEISIIETELTLDGKPMRDWVDVWNYWA
jgi:hypothetical protein